MLLWYVLLSLLPPIHQAGLISDVILYDGKSTYTTVELSDHIEFKDFTISVWFNLHRKVSNGHLPQCIFAKGDWVRSKPRDTTIAFYVTSTSRLILSLNLKRGKEIECELVGDPLQFSRWYHFAFDYSATGHLNAYLNGIATAVTCTYNGTNRINIFDGDNFLMQRIGFVPTGSIAYDKRENEAFYMTIGSCSHSTEGPSPEDFLFSGMISNFTLFMSALDASAVRAIAKEWVVPIGASVAVVEPSLQLLSSECLSCDSSDSKHKVQHRKDDSPIDASSEFSSIRSNWRVFGSLVSTVDPQFGDCVLSVMLSVAQAKVDLGNAGAKIKLGNLFNMTDESQVVNRALVATLNKHFLINEEQEGVWNALNMYSTRLEMVGHSLSLTNKELVSKDVSVRHRDNPIVALITPVTSRGTEPTMLGDLPLLRALLPSLYATRSAGFDYKVYLIVNEHDKVFGNSNLVRLIFSMAKETWKDFFLQESLGDVDYEVVIVPDSMTPKHALSGLFNHGTLRAYHDNCDYFYLVNDDLLLISPGWTELFTQSLLSSPMLPGLGVAGGVDVSDSITPQIEFPFFHRTHVNIFHWCGANPWTFSNWWEDNWLTDVYIPFNAVFYESRVLLSNYVGLDRSPVSNSVSSDAFLSIGTLDPRYEVVEGRRTPDFYRAEVERGRDLIVSYLQNYVSAKEVADINTSYCYREGGKIPTLASMHLNYHEEPLDPCDSHLESSPYDERRYRTSIHEKEMPHHSYAELVEKERELVEGETLMSKYYGGALFASAECQQLLNNGLNSQDAALMAQCAESVGITSAGMLSNKGYLINPPMLKGDLCRREGVGVIQYNSCALTVPRNVLIIHNHCPLFTRYGSDKRLFHIAETFRALGYNVHFGGMEVSGFETEDDHLRVKSLGARLYSPLTARTDAELFLDPYKMDTMLKEVQPDIVVLTMWFWNVDPVAVMFMRPVREKAPNAKIIILSDDAHTMREQALQQTKLSHVVNKIFSKVKVANIFKLEYSAYQLSDAVLTITKKDKNRILATQQNLEHYEFLGASPEKLRVDDFRVQTVRYALSNSEISEIVPAFQSRGDCLVFIGNGANPTNIDAMKWFFDDIFELLIDIIHPSQVHLKLIGADWKDFVLSYPLLAPYVQVTGLLRQGEMTDILHFCKVFVSPITTVSTGLNTKNILALSRGIPLVTTTSGADGLNDWSQSDNQRQEYVISDTAVDFAKQTVAFLFNETLWKDASDHAMAYVRKHFSLSAQAQDLESIISVAYNSKVSLEMTSDIL